MVAPALSSLPPAVLALLLVALCEAAVAFFGLDLGCACGHETGDASCRARGARQHKGPMELDNAGPLRTLGLGFLMSRRTSASMLWREYAERKSGEGSCGRWFQLQERSARIELCRNC